MPEGACSKQKNGNYTNKRISFQYTANLAVYTPIWKHITEDRIKEFYNSNGVTLARLLTYLWALGYMPDFPLNVAVNTNTMANQ